MRLPRTIYSPLIALLLTLAPHARAQADAPSQSPAPYRLNVSVDEVILTFHAADAHGLPINDLKLSDLTLLDNGIPPAKILDFQLQQNFPIRAGILIDTSTSMSPHRFRDQSIATEYAQQLLRQQTDQAFVLNFDRTAQLIQSWTSNPTELTAAIHNTTPGVSAPERCAPAKKTPCTMPRSLAGIQREKTRAALGHVPASPIPKRNRSASNDG